MRTRLLLSVLATLSLVACGSSSSNTTDAPPGSGNGDGGGNGSGSGSGGPHTLTLSGTTKEISASGTDPLPGVMITAYKASDDSVLGMVTSAADGTFSISVTTTTAIDGYLKATYGTNYKTTYLYPPYPLTMDYPNVPVYVVSAANYGLVNGFLLGNGQTAQEGWVAMLVQDATGAAVAGATTTSTPMGTVNYNGTDGKPSKTATATFTDGIAYDTAIAAGTVTVSAAATGATFMSHAIKVRPDVLTLTIVTE